MLNPCRDLEYPFALGIMDMSTINVPPKKDIPAEHALDKDDVVDPTEGLKPVDREISQRTLWMSPMISALM
jgi:hypothetical protein